MRVLSLHQPWASLIALGEKTVETRSWAHPYRGPLAIHAARTRMHMGLVGQLTFKAAFDAHGVDPSELPLGVIVAVCDLTAIHDAEPGLKIPRHACAPREGAFGNFTAGRKIWVLENVVAIQRPIALRGMQGLVTLALDVEEQLLSRVRDQGQRRSG